MGEKKRIRELLNRNKKKIIIWLAVGIPALFLVTLLVANVLMPLHHRKIDESYREFLDNTAFLSDQVATERVKCVDDNAEAMLWRLRMFATAKESIVLSTFDFRADESGLDVMAALYEAAQRGVHVRLLIDGIYQPVFLRNSDAFHALCAHENVEAKIYNPICLKNIYRFNYRMHDKYILIDDRMYLLGGRNTSDTFLGEMRPGANIDREVLVYHTESGKGESFQQLEEYFNCIWHEPCATPVNGKNKQKVNEEEYDKFTERYRGLFAKYGDFTAYQAWNEDTVPANKITLISNETHAGMKQPRVLKAIEQLACAADEVLIQTPYVICNQDMYDTLRSIGGGTDLRIILNAVERGTNPWGCTDYLNNKKKILECGADVYELMNDYAMHTKAVLIDSRISVVGSYNLDMRSTYLDTELMLVIDSEPLNRQIRDGIASYRDKSVEVLSDGTQTKGSLYQDKELSGKKRMIYSVLRVIIRPFRHLL